MATKFNTTPPAAIEAPPLSPLATAFAALLTVLEEHVTAERDLAKVDAVDAAYQDKLDAADDAQDALYAELAAITALTPTCAEDVPLRRMTLILATLVREGTASAFRRYADCKPEFATYLAVPGEGTAALHVAHLLAAADRRISQMAGLPLYLQDGVSLEAETERDAELLAA
ncbi:hypothetical protein MLD63_15280 [Paracoccus sp. TK19116]|uniref:Uncharacterized protein n=1 Tax=Paracoccus albicereus TaxID=2922394 RepID=A0ABT1MUH4_9RHOB|nr:hypothetical protein [Paracoccus albicereus]MCQ0971784.1 hypothetical protein [Paracoccus albicereus]